LAVGNTVYLTVRLAGQRDDTLTFGSQLLDAFKGALLTLLDQPSADVSMLNITFVLLNETAEPLVPPPARRLQSTPSPSPGLAAGNYSNGTCTWNVSYLNVSDTLYTMRAILPGGENINSTTLAQMLSDAYLVASAFRTVMRIWFNCPSLFGEGNVTDDMLPGGPFWPFKPLDATNTSTPDYFGGVITDSDPFIPVGDVSPSVTRSATPSFGSSATPTRTTSHTRTRSATPSATSSASVSATPSSTPPVTSSRSATRLPPASATATRTRKARTGVSSTTLTPRPSVSRTGTPSKASTGCPTLPPLTGLPSRVLTVVRVGDATRSAATATAGTALPVYIDILALNGTRLGTRPLTTRGSTACGQACTLSAGKLGSTSTSWFWDTEGLPSTSVDGRFVVLPCHTSPVGAPASLMLEDDKTIAILSRATMAVDTSMRFTANTGQRGTGTSWRQAATIDGTSFWTIGVAQFWSGVRYLPTRATKRSLHLHGQTWYQDTVAPGWAQIGTRDIRGMAIANGNLYVSSAFVTEPSANGARDPYRPWGGVVQLMSGVPTTEFGADFAKLLPGFNGRRNWQSFTFVGATNLWALEDMSTYRSFTSPSPATVIQARTALSTVLTHFKYDAVKKTWTEVAAHRVSLGASALYSLATSVSGTTTTLFATDRTRVVSVTVAAGGVPVVNTIAAPPTGGHFRGVAVF
jgi:hypothetical protein